MEEVVITTYLDSLIQRVQALVSTNGPPSVFRLTRTIKDTRYNREYCINIFHNDLLILRRCESLSLKGGAPQGYRDRDVELWERLDEEAVVEFMMYAIFGKQNMIDETVTLRKTKRDASKGQ